MAKPNYPNELSLTSERNPSFQASNTAWQAEDFQKKVTEEIAQMRRNELDGVDLQDHIITEPDDSQPLTVEPPLTLSKIFPKLTPVEQLWLARMVKSHGKELVLARWPAYEIHINYVRYLR